MLRINPHYWEQKREQERIDRIKFGRERWEVELDKQPEPAIIPAIVEDNQVDQLKAQILHLEKRLNETLDKQTRKGLY